MISFLGAPFLAAPFDVVDGALVGAHAGDSDVPQGGVGLAVAARVEPVADDLARGRLDGADPPRPSPGRLRPQPARVVTGGHQQGGGAVLAHPVQAEQPGVGQEAGQELVELLAFGVELDPAAEARSAVLVA